MLWLHPAHAASIISRSNSYPLNSRSNSLGSKANLIISNEIVSPDGFARSATLAGGTFPGPIIAAKKGEQFEINVVNKLTDDEMFKSTSVHWHGINQNGSNYADGVSFVTQCPIAQNHSFLYSFNAQNQAGTFWYHSHYSVQQCDGLRGPLIIYDPKDPLSYLYDIDDESTVITLADWYHVVAPVLSHIIGTNANSSLINGLGRYQGGPSSELAVVNVEYGKRYRLRLIAMSCDPSFAFSIDNHNLTIIEADGELTQPLLVDSLQILAGQRYSVVLVANQPVANYWLRALPSTPGLNFNNGQSSAILRYKGAPVADPTTKLGNSTMPLIENNLHALINPGAPGIPEYGKADINLKMVVNSTRGVYSINNASYVPPTVPVLLQILSGAQQATDLLPKGSVYVLGANKVVELTMLAPSIGGPHPIHLHGHSFDVVQSAGNSSFNYVNPVRRDVVSSGLQNQQMVIRWVTDNSGPWFLHCHIDWHLDAGFAVVMAESPSDTQQHIGHIPNAWNELCPTFNSLTPAQIGAQNSYQEAQNISTILFPNT
ncbi:multicopper oxidase [Suillus luteus UH-Slu-Lm8-n1]|uniref:Multicopper oxidase n=1 Tax=Suillus luteus UH-Slu-Lm8-n1 TaxID=930992 RepID=A0A0D0AW73_9AGAM|nr:multicopper oxidase [Suillus luteus UH-Slu-Lm8-n1]